MPDVINTIWVDATFIPSKDAEQGTHDKYVEYTALPAENIGSYSIPAVVTFKEASITADIDVRAEYNVSAPIGVYVDLRVIYYVYELPFTSNYIDINTEFYSESVVVSGTRNIPVIYSTGFSAISGSLDKRIIFTAGVKRDTVENILIDFEHYSSTVIATDYIVNYMNFSGDATPSGTPIAFFNNDSDYIVDYFSGWLENTTPGLLDKIVDISFAGWVPETIYGDVYCAVEGQEFGYTFEATTISGGLFPNYIEVYSTVLTASGVTCEVYCALTEMSYTDYEVEIIPGRIGYLETDIYSAMKNFSVLTLDIDLYSMKFANFFPAPDDYTDAVGFISVDVLDDTCPISTSGTYFLVDGVQVPVTFSGIQDGYRMFYDPADDFASLEGPTTFTAHAENECGNTLEQDYYLTFGYLVEFENFGKIDYGFKNKVAVRVVAENYASCPHLSSLAWDFESRELRNGDLSASINGRAFALDNEDMSAEIYPQSTAYFYGKEFRVVVNAKDFAGNKMEPLVLIYKIEDKP